MYNPISRFYNPKKAKEEREKKEERERYLQERKDYFETMKKDWRFKKYFIDEIVKHNISVLSDVTKIPISENLRDEVRARQITIDTLNKILFNVIN